MNAIIIEDSSADKQVLELTLKEYCPEVQVLGSAIDVVGGIEKVETFEPDVIFLDIEMGDDSLAGFHFLEETISNFGKVGFEIIFVTSHHEYAIKAFKFCALDYLLKPIDKDELISAVSKVKTSTTEQSAFDLLLENHRANDPMEQRIAISDPNGKEIVPLKEIIRIEAANNASMIYRHSVQKTYEPRRISEFEEMLRGLPFYQTHRSHIVNLKEVKKVLSKLGNLIVMSDGAKIPLVKERKKEFLEKLDLL